MNKQKIYQFIIVLINIFFIWATLLNAHPHTFIKVQIGVEFDNSNKIKGIWEEWEFDEMSSVWCIEECDLNHDGKFSDGEQKKVYKDYFSNVEHYGYFTSFRDSNKRISAKNAQNFTAKIKNKKTIYKFFIPLENKNSDGLIFSIFDPTFFCAIAYLKKDPIYFINTDQMVTSYKIIQNKKYPVYYNPSGAPDDQRVYLKWKPGLQTAYPEEVMISIGK